MKSFIEIAREKANESFTEEQKNYPDLYTDILKPLFITCYVDGYLQGYSDSLEVGVSRLDHLSDELADNSNNEKV